MLNCKNISTSIRRAEQKLVAKAGKSGIYENFGQCEARAIRAKFIDISDYSNEMNKKRCLLSSFENWCSTFTG